jgi:hypothetical protein
MSTQEPPQFTEEELRAIEAEMQKVTVDDVLLQTVVTLLNLGARKAGLGAPPGRGEAGGEAEGQDRPREPDLDQVRQAIDGARALMPLVETRHSDKLGPIRDALSRLQMLYAQRASGQPAGAEAPTPPEKGPGEAQRSGRLWVPGQ